MKRRVIGSVFSSFLLICLIFLHSSAWADTPAKKGAPGIQVKAGQYVPAELVVKFKDMPKARMAQVAENFGARLVNRIDEGNYYLFRFVDDQKAAMAMKSVKKRGDVAAVFRNIIFSIPKPILYSRAKELAGSGDVRSASWTNDPSRSSQWHLARIKDDIAPNPISPAPLIAVVDSGVDYNHVDLAGKVIKGYDFIDYDDDPMDVNGHGTHVAGIAAAGANNKVGTAGVSRYSKILAVRVLDQDGSGTFFTLASGINYAKNYPGVKIINMSLEAYVGPSSDEYKAMRTIINDAFDSGKIVVCAAGNQDNIPIYRNNYADYPIPASYPKSFTVAATNENDFRTLFSNYSTNKLKFVDIAAPGLGILSTIMGDGYAPYGGTSMSAPIVAGAAAVVWAASPKLTNVQVQNRLKESGVLLREDKGFPVAVRRVDINRALRPLQHSTTLGVQGRVIDSVTGRPIKGATVKVYKLPANTLVRKVSTKADGFFTVPSLSAATSYKVQANKAGYIEYSQSCKIPNAGFREWVNYYLVPNRKSTGTDQNWTIAVDWNSVQPGQNEWQYNYYYGYPWMPKWQNTAGREMNGFLRLPSSQLIYYGKPGTLGAFPYTKFMRDSLYDNVATESIVIRKQVDGTYKFAVLLDPGYVCWGKFVGSGAMVRVYKGTTLKRTFKVSAATGKGTKWWYVFDLTGNTVTPKQKLLNTSPL